MLTRKQLKRLNQCRSRHGRRKSDAMLVEGVRCCMEALQRRPDWLEIIVLSHSLAESADGIRMVQCAREAGVSAEILPDSDVASLAVTDNPQGILCLMRRPPVLPAACGSDPLVLILDRIREPGNLGTILRTAWAVGLTTLWLTDGSADPYAPKVIRSGMGAQFALEVGAVPDLRTARDILAAAGKGPLWLAVPHDGVDCFSEAFAPAGGGLVIGNEATGIEDLSAGVPVSIPMPGAAESLNAAQAATVLLFEAVRRGILGGGAPHGTAGGLEPAAVASKTGDT